MMTMMLCVVFWCEVLHPINVLMGPAAQQRAAAKAAAEIASRMMSGTDMHRSNT